MNSNSFLRCDKSIFFEASGRSLGQSGRAEKISCLRDRVHKTATRDRPTPAKLARRQSRTPGKTMPNCKPDGPSGVPHYHSACQTNIAQILTADPVRLRLRAP